MNHTVDIPVHVGTGDAASSSVLHVCGQGLLQHPSAAALQLPRHLSADVGRVIPQSPALRLQEPCIDLGVTRPHGAVRALVVLESTSQRDVSFRWHAGELNGEGASEGGIAFEPAEGVLYPGERLGCLVTYQAGMEDQWLEGEVALLIAEGDDEAGAGELPRAWQMNSTGRMQHVQQPQDEIKTCVFAVMMPGVGSALPRSRR